jgi:SAM-dependent methyltransferase
MTRRQDGSAGDADYGAIGGGYARYRQTEPRIAAAIHQFLGDPATSKVLNVGAGAGSYEPAGWQVTAVEPSASMRAQRPAHLPAAIDAVAEELPFPDQSFDAALATFTVHQWSDLRRGLSELCRVTRGPIVILTCDPQEVQNFWLNDYAPEVLATEARRYPPLDSIAAGLGGAAQVIPVPIPLDCLDGFNEAYYGRPERLLEDGARQACSAWSFVDQRVVDRFQRHLAGDLHDGTWDKSHAHLRTQPVYEGSLKLVVSQE